MIRTPFGQVYQGFYFFATFSNKKLAIVMAYYKLDVKY